MDDAHKRVARRGGVESRVLAEEVSVMKKSQVIIGMWVLLTVMTAFLPAAGGTPPPGGTTVADDEVTLPKPTPSCMVQPAYPEPERAAGSEGTVFLGVEVKADGTVGSIKAERDVQGHPAFTASAVAAVRKWCFEPARKDGQPVACTVTIPVRFVLDEKKKPQQK
jgi:TonB family protein